MDNQDQQQDQDIEYLRTLDHGKPFEPDLWVFSGEQLFTVTDVAEHLRWSPDFVRTLAEQGNFPQSLKHPNPRVGWRLYWKDVAAYIGRLRRQQNEQRATGTA